MHLVRLGVHVVSVFRSESFMPKPSTLNPHSREDLSLGVSRHIKTTLEGSYDSPVWYPPE